ncbi:MAG: 4Fe-4S ferredoxin, partial [Methanoregula sp.]
EIDRMRCIVCASCIEAWPTKCISMDTLYPEAMTARGGIYKVTVAGPKKKEPVDGAPAKAREKKE